MNKQEQGIYKLLEISGYVWYECEWIMKKDATFKEQEGRYEEEDVDTP